jgi:hypothetical protein
VWTAERASEDRRSIRYIVARSAAELVEKLQAAETAGHDRRPVVPARAPPVRAASSSRSQVPMRTASSTSCLTWKLPSVSVHWRVPLEMAIVTHLVTRLLAGRCCEWAV